MIAGVSLRLRPRTGLAIAMLVLAASLLAATGLAALDDAWARRVALERLAEGGSVRPRPLLAGGMSQAAADHPAAIAALARRVRQIAAGRRLLVERIDPLEQAEDMPLELALSVSLSGPEPDIIEAARLIEGGLPAARFVAWRIARTGRSETAVRLEGRLIAYWEPRP